MAEADTTLNVSDIIDAVRIIDFAAEQGIFKGWDTVRSVLALRDRLQAFLTAANVSLNTPAPSAS